ncbi:CPBP family intramembrane glutamic endopeptidase [Paludisphaera sp.]|uniref:CPBP family intramembrane glutamic endopeptidase n=1 Tax=Paludisphaera sp. TaxID=2017432 RepID=UPI00301B8A97
MQDRDDFDHADEEPHPEGDAPGHDLIIVLGVFGEGGLAPLAVLLGWFLSWSPLRDFSWDLGAALLGAVLAVPPLVAMLTLLRHPFGRFVQVKRFFEDELLPLLNNSRWGDLVLIAIATGVGEEMLFRGLFQPILASELGTPAAVLLTSIIFAALHPISIPYFYVMLALGVYLGTVCVFSGNLLTSMTCHGAYNFLLLARLLRLHDPNRPMRNPIEALDSDQSIDDHD